MTLATFRLRRDMINLFAYCDDSIMTRCAVVTHTRMIESRSSKVDEVIYVMTIRTIPSGWQMIRTLSRAYIAVVARCAAIRNSYVAKDRSHESIGAEMTYTTVFGSRHMINILARSNHPIVAACASNGINHRWVMIKHTCGKVAGGMTSITI